MNAFRDDIEMRRSACGCCARPGSTIPAQIDNRHGLNEIAYRIGTFNEFRNSLLDRLAGTSLPSLSRLNPHEDDDVTIALLDAWSAVADVLTFYQERIANESWLRTATERQSLFELARLIGYRPAAGVAASVDLAFTLEDAPGAKAQALRKTVIDERTRVQSVPGPGEKPQLFETVETVGARVEWNSMHPQLTKHQTISQNMTTLWLEDGGTLIKAGDTVLLVTESGEPSLRHVTAVEEKGKELLHVSVDPEQTLASSYPENPNTDLAIALEKIASGKVILGKQILGGMLPQFVGDLMSGTVQAQDLYALGQINGVIMEELFDAINAAHDTTVQLGEEGAYAFRRRASLFGYNAQSKTYNENGAPSGDIAWSTDGESPDALYLDGSYDGIAIGSMVVIRMLDEAPQVHTVKNVQQCSRTAYGLSGKSTRLELSGPWWNIVKDSKKTAPFAYIRGVTVEFESESLPLAAEPLSEHVDGTSILCDRAYPGLEEGHRLIIQGEIYDTEALAGTGQTGSEIKVLSGVRLVDGRTELQFAVELSNSYVRDGLEIFGNVARATHGETVRELLGFGNAAKSFQTFALRHAPLTWVSSDAAAGSSSTLHMYVNNVLWKEVKSLYEKGPTDRVCVTSTDDEGNTSVIFGDGQTGARLPSGQNNVDAVYRKGIGLEGNVGRETITMLLDKPLGVKKVRNPIAANGGDDPETSDDIRRNAALPIMTLERVVSMQDYEDFARAYVGVAKAHAEVRRDGGDRMVVLTVLGPNATEILAGQSTHDGLSSALTRYGDPFVRIQVVSRTPTLFRLAGGIRVADDYRDDEVLEEAIDALRLKYAFDARSFGEPVTLSEIYAVLHTVKGIVMADIDALYPLDPDGAFSQTAELRRRIAAEPASRLPDQRWQGAEMLIIDPYSIDLEVLT